MRSNASMFRTFARLEEQMMRAAMPRTSAADPQETARFSARPATVALPLTYTLEEVTRES